MIVVVIVETILLVIISVIFVAIPICKKGLVEYVGKEREINPVIRRISNLFLERYNMGISKKWLKRVCRLTEEEVPVIQWKEEATQSGLDSFYCLDQQSEDVRDLLLPLRNLVHDKMNWWRSRFSNKYMFVSNGLPIIQPCYEIKRENRRLCIKTGSQLDTWIYLVSKQKQPTIYALDFDFIPHIEMQETLQLCFASSSLASRFRFNLENNKTLKFDVVDHGNFTWWQNTEEWKSRFMEKCSFPLHEITHIRLLVIENIFAIYHNNQFKMAVRVDDYVPVKNYWYLIFWNGIEIESSLNIEISNFKILHASNN